MSYQRRSHSQDNEIYENIIKNIKKSHLRSRSLHKPIILQRDCIFCIQQYFKKKTFYYFIGAKVTKLFKLLKMMH